MIELSPHTAIMAYLCLALGGILGLWAFGHLAKKRENTPLPEKKLHVCEYCQGAYIAKSFEPVSKCPLCQSYNRCI